MNIKYSIILALILSTNIVIAQNWEHYYGQDGVLNISKDISESYDKGYLLLGRNYFEGNPDWISQPWLIKTDINGELLWEKVLLNNDQIAHAFAIEPTEDGGNLLCGILHANYKYYPFIVKLGPCGDKEWCHRIPGALNDQPAAIDLKELPNGNIVMLVNMFGDGTYESLHLFMMDSIGQILWQNPYCSGFEHDLLRPLGKSIQITSDNKIIICGSSYWKNPWEPGSEYYWIRPTFTKVDPETGEEEWVLPFGLQDTITGKAYDIHNISQNSFIGISAKYPSETMQSTLIEIDSMGNVTDFLLIVNDSIAPTIDKGVPLNIKVVDSLYVIGGIYGDIENGYSSEFTIDTSVFSNGFELINFIHHINMDDPTISLTSDQKILSNSTFKEPGNWDIYLTKLNLNLEQDSSYSAPLTYDSLCPHPILSGFISLDDCFPVGVDEGIPTPQQYFDSISSIQINVYPNPASGHINFSLKNTEHHNNIILETYNIHGQLIEKREIFKSQQEVTIDLNKYSNGIYAVFISSNENKSAGKSKFVVQRQ